MSTGELGEATDVDPGVSPGADAGSWRDGLVQLGPDWVLGDDGMPYRRAARIIALDPAGRLLLARGHDVDEPDRHWWFTVGGGIDAGETPRDAAVRELREETGLLADPAHLVGPVARRTAIFDFAARHVRQDEEFFVLRLEGSDAAFDTAGWTEVELRFMDELRWWDLDDLAAQPEQVYPAGCVEIVRGLLDGWDGTVLELGVEE